LPAKRALRLATIDGARALGLEQEIGSLETGKRADVIIVQLDCLHSTPRPADITSAVVYSAQASDVRSTIIDGRLVMHERELLTMDEREVIEEANREALLLRERAENRQA
jgi:5-methylthioadenosine/S-adenosylhomocysteine deaminase